MKTCELCGRGTAVGVDGTHNYGGGWARRATRTRKVWKVNLRTAKILTDDGAGRRIKICMKCYKGLKKGRFKNLKLAYTRGQIAAK